MGEIIVAVVAAVFTLVAAAWIAVIELDDWRLNRRAAAGDPQASAVLRERAYYASRPSGWEEVAGPHPPSPPPPRRRERGSVVSGGAKSSPEMLRAEVSDPPFILSIMTT